MRNILLFIALGLTLLSCGGSPGQFRLKGNFAHLEQGEFLLYSTDGGLDIIDTLHLVDGKFDYTTKLHDEATYHILYPNFSELVVFGHSGGIVNIKGDARSLNEVEVHGDKENETYTKFRKEIDQKDKKATVDVARKYILENPTLSMSKYLFTQYFLQSEEITKEETKEVYDSLTRALPNDVNLSRLSDDIRSKGALAIGKEFPLFELSTRDNAIDSTKKGKIITPKDFSGKALLIAFWATWKSGSQSAPFRLKRASKEYKENMDVLSYSLDIQEEPLHATEVRDSVTYHSFCDFLCWRSPLVRQLGIVDIPYYILLDSTQHIIATGTEWAKDIEPKAKDLCL